MSSRLERALHQRLLMLEETLDVASGTGLYSILGSTGRTYEVDIAPEGCTCTCPDHRQRSVSCKHILFVLVQVLGREPYAPLTRHSLQTSFRSRLDQRPPVLAPQVQLVTLEPSPVNQSISQKPLDDTDCPICLESLHPSESIVYCQTTCGNNVHDICMKRWIQQRKTGGPCCPFCRGPWVV